AQAAALHQAVYAFDTSAPSPERADGGAAGREPRKAVLEADAAVRRSAEELKDYWGAALDEFTAWRYAREAGDNRRQAAVLEVQVRQSSYHSDRHHDRSQNFFIGMLAAQAGVVISSMAVAARRKSSLWLLASVAGVLALG